MRSIEDLSLLTHAESSSMHPWHARPASHALPFFRIDYPAIDPPEWNKFVTVKLENNKVKTGALPLNYWAI